MLPVVKWMMKVARIGRPIDGYLYRKMNMHRCSFVRDDATSTEKDLGAGGPAGCSSAQLLAGDHDYDGN